MLQRVDEALVFGCQVLELGLKLVVLLGQTGDRIGKILEVISFALQSHIQLLVILKIETIRMI